MVATDVVELRVLNEGPDLGALEVLDLVLVRGGEVRAHAPVVAGDDHAAAAGGLGGVDAVFGAEARGGAGIAKDGGIFVGANATDVED